MTDLKWYVPEVDKSKNTMDIKGTIPDNPDSFPVKYCESCQLPWEIDKTTSGKKTRVVHYQDFPKLGLVHQTCPDCK